MHISLYMNTFGQKHGYKAYIYYKKQQYFKSMYSFIKLIIKIHQHVICIQSHLSILTNIGNLL